MLSVFIQYCEVILQHGADYFHFCSPISVQRTHFVAFRCAAFSTSIIDNHVLKVNGEVGSPSSG